MAWQWSKRRWDSAGVAMPLIGVAFFALIGMTGIAIDVGRLYAVRTELTRSLDAGALAGVQEMPDMTKAKAIAVDYVMTNDPTATSVTAVEDGGDPRRLRVTASKIVPMTFLKVLKINQATVTQSSVAGLGTIPLDIVMAIDTTGSMCQPASNGPCTSGPKIDGAQEAANALVDAVLTGPIASNTSVGMVPFRWCYKPPATGPNAVGCVPAGASQVLTNDPSSLKSKINALDADSYTNICMGILAAKDILYGPGAHAEPRYKAMIVLSDGANTRTESFTTAGCGTSPVAGLAWPECPGNGQGDQMDRNTYNRAQEIKALGVEIFTVMLNPCPLGTSPTSAGCNTGQVGSFGDFRARNLMKCIASSLPGSNDHYFETNDPTQLKSIFLSIVQLLALRLIE